MGTTFSARRILAALTATAALVALVPSQAGAQLVTGLQPEDAFGHHVSVSADGERLYTAATYCSPQEPGCPQVLFGSTDGGSTWAQLPARLFRGFQVLLPPDAADDRIFALSAANLQVSEDGGQTFLPTAPAGFQATSAAISPAFNDGDPTFLIGGNPTTMYNDETNVVTPIPGLLAARGGLSSNPAFAPGYPDDPRTAFGHYALNGEPNTLDGAVTVCEGLIDCSTTRVSVLAPEIRFAPDFADGGALYAFDQNAAFVSNDGGQTFEDITPAGRATIWDMEVLQDGSLLLGRTFSPFGDAGAEGMFRSNDGGTSWSKVDNALLNRGISSIASGEDTVLAAFSEWAGANRGIACSADGGLTWATRCP